MSGLPPGPTRTGRCVILFARPSRHEARLKQVAFAAPLFEYTRRRVEAAVGAMPGVDLLLSSDDPTSDLPQRGTSFGERLENAFNDARALGYSQIIAVGADAPGLGGRQIAAAFQRLESHEVVLGRATDGGAYLIGTRGDIAALMRGVPWCTSSACASLAANAGQPSFLDDRLADVDSGRDLFTLRDDPALEADAKLLLRQLLGPRPSTHTTRHQNRPERPVLRRLRPRAPPITHSTHTID